MKMCYRDKLGLVKVELSNTESVAFFDGYVFATTANDEFMKIRIEDLLYIED